MKRNGWMVFQGIQLMLFLCVSFFLLVRDVDGSGAVQTAEGKLLSLGVWAVFFAVVLVVEWIVRCLIGSRNK